MVINITQLVWCNSYLGSSRKNWNNNMSFFILGHKFDVYFLNMVYIQFLLYKTLFIIKSLTRKRKKIIFIISKFVLEKSKLLKRKKPFKYLNENLRNLSIVVLSNWIFGLLTNFKRVNLENQIIPINVLPLAVFILINKITDTFDYVNIVREANRLNILSFGLIDTDQNPTIFDYPVISNSKSFESTNFYYKFYMSYLYLCNLKTKANFYNFLLFNYMNE